MQPQYPAQYPAQPAYAPQFPQQPAAPAYPQQPMQGYPQPAAPGYPPQYMPPTAYAPAPQYAPPAPPAQPLPTGTLDSFYQQPSTGGGPSFKFQDANRQPQIGKSYAGIVARPVTDADIRAQTNDGGQVQTYRDGRPKFVMVVPMQVQPSQEFPDGQAGWWVKGQARDELARAMAEAGAPAGPPETGAAIRITLVSIRPIPGRNPAYQYRVEYMRPQGAAPVVNQAVASAPVAAPMQQAPAAQPLPVVSAQYTPTPAPVQQYLPGGPVEQHNNPYAPVQPVQQPVAVAQPAPVAAPLPQAPAPAAQPAAVPDGFNPDQAALFAKLTGQQAAPVAG